MRNTIITASITLAMATTSICHAQDADDLMRESVVLMEKDSWQDALAKVSKIIENHGKKGVQTFGAKFGVAYYYQGLCQLKLAQQARKEAKKEAADKLYKKSIETLQKCYAIKSTEDDFKKGSTNNYRVKALMLLGNAQQAIDQFEIAIQSYEKFLLERNNIGDTFNLADFNINLAICYWKSSAGENDEKAENLYLRALRSVYQPADANSKITGLRAMIESYSTRHKLDQVEAFMRKNGQYFSVSLPNAIEALPYISAMSLEASQQNLLETSSALSTAIPTQAFLDISENNIPLLKKCVELYAGENLLLGGVEIDDLDLDKWIDKQDETLAAIKKAELLAICAKAINFEKLGFDLGALASYERLLESEEIATTEHHADYLYNASRLAIRLNKIEKSFRYGHQLLSDYPSHKYATKLRKQLMLAFYYTGEYEKCIAIGEQDIKDTDKLDLVTHAFTLGGSYYYEGNFQQAEPLLKQLQELTGENPYKETSDYLYASTCGKLHRWNVSIQLLDKYIASNPKDQTYIPFAYYDKAYTLYSMQKYPEAVLALKPFRTNFDTSLIKPEAHILLGNMASVKRERQLAQLEYKKAIVSAKKVNNQHAKEEAYYLIISLLGQRTWDGLANPEILKTIPFLEDFLKEPNAHQSPYFTQIITSSFEALDRAKRKNEAYEKLEEAILRYNHSPNTPGIETAIKTYTIAKRKEEVSDDDVIAAFTNSKYLKNTPYHTGLLLGIELEVLELSQRLSPKPERAERIKQIILNLFVEYDIAVLDNFVLIKIAAFMKDNLGSEGLTNAKKYYQAILNSGSKIKQPQALVGLASELAKSDNADDRLAAVKRFKAIINDPFTLAKPKAAAHYQLLEILYASEDYPELIKQIKAYVKYPSKVKENIRRVEMLLAISYDKLNLTDKAIGAYNSVWVNSFENLDQSAPAIDRITDLIWQRNNPAKEGLQDGKSDKQLAYETCYKYIHRTETHYENNRTSMTSDGIKAWENIQDKIKTFEIDKDVTPLK